MQVKDQKFKATSVPVKELLKMPLVIPPWQRGDITSTKWKEDLIDTIITKGTSIGEIDLSKKEDKNKKVCFLIKDGGQRYRALIHFKQGKSTYRGHKYEDLPIPAKLRFDNHIINVAMHNNCTTIEDRIGYGDKQKGNKMSTGELLAQSNSNMWDIIQRIVKSVKLFEYINISNIKRASREALCAQVIINSRHFRNMSNYSAKHIKAADVPNILVMLEEHNDIHISDPKVTGLVEMLNQFSEMFTAFEENLSLGLSTNKMHLLVGVLLFELITSDKKYMKTQYRRMMQTFFIAFFVHNKSLGTRFPFSGLFDDYRTLARSGKQGSRGDTTLKLSALHNAFIGFEETWNVNQAKSLSKFIDKHKNELKIVKRRVKHT